MNVNKTVHINNLYTNNDNSLNTSILESLLNELTYPMETPNYKRNNLDNNSKEDLIHTYICQSPHGLFEKNNIWGPPNELPKQITNWNINTVSSKKITLNPNAPEFIFPNK
jgi:hypothetical protein